MKRTILTIALCIVFTALTIACGNNIPSQTEPATTEKQVESSSENHSTEILETLRKIDTDGEQRTEENFNAWDYVDQ